MPGHQVTATTTADDQDAAANRERAFEECLTLGYPSALCEAIRRGAVDDEVLTPGPSLLDQVQVVAAEAVGTLVLTALGAGLVVVGLSRLLGGIRVPLGPLGSAGLGGGS